MSYIKYFNESGKSYIGTTAGGTTSSTSIVKLSSIAIPANTFRTGDYINIEGMFSKYGINNQARASMYYNTGDTMTGALQIGTRTLGTTDGFHLFTRKLFISDASGGGSGNNAGTQVITSSINYESDHQFGFTTLLGINWTSTVYIISAGLVINASDTIENYGFKLYTY